ncbi:MAG: hypothetical protein IKJ97_02620 [Bacteroidaceae bacterium]|nr:hypothetical protein [Bacteroidaceae bacterium]
MRKFTLLIASLLFTIGAMAQFETGKEYRIKVVDGVAAGEYVTIGDNFGHAFGYVHTMALDVNNADQKFTFVSSNGNWKVKSVNEEYLAHTGGTVTGWNDWNLNKTTNESSATEVIFVSTGTENEYYLRANTNQYFKAGAVDQGASSYKHVYYNAPEGERTKFAVEEINAIPEVVYETEEVGNPAEDGVYRIYWKGEGRGYLAYHDEYPTKPVLADVDLSGHNGIEKHYKSTESGVQRDWYLITSESGKKYLFSPYTGKFLTYSKDAADTGKGALYDANRPLEVAVEANSHSSWSSYFILTATIDDVKYLLSSGCGTASRGNNAGYPVRWVNAGGQMHDGGSPLTFVKVIGFPAVDEAIMAQAEAAINDYENPVEDNVTLQWTESTPWATATDLTSTVLNDNAYTDGIKYVELEDAITVAGARTVTATFAYTGGRCRLNMRGVEVLDADGNIVAGDYHVGFAGGQVENNTYTVKVAQAGTYTVRCYVTEGGDGNGNTDSLSETAGTITVAFAKLNVIDLTKEVTFTADYATLHLGYSVAVPAGVEAYVVSATNATWATLEQVNNVIPAATPVILKKTGTATSYNFYYTSDEADEIETNLLEGSIADRYVAADAYVLGINNEEVGLYTATKNQLTNTAFKNNANKAYLPKTAGMNAASYSFRFGEGTTGIDQITDNREQSTAIFDLTGRRVEAISAPGIYIINGKKVLVK